MLHRLLPTLAVMVFSVPGALCADIDLVILAGQSNMVGRATSAQEELEVEQDVLYWYSLKSPRGDWTEDSGEKFGPLTTWSNPQSGAAEHGPEYSFAKELARGSDHRLALVKVATGGSSIAQWQPGEADFERLVANVHQAVQWLKAEDHRPRLQGMVWLQGESDARQGRSSLYSERLQLFATRLRQDLHEKDVSLGFDQMRIVLVEPATRRYAWNPHTKVVATALRAYAQQTDGVTFVPTADLDGYVDRIHFDAASQREIGQRAAVALRDLQ